MFAWVKAHKFEIITLVFVCIVVDLAVYIGGHGLFMLFDDTDDHMRLIRIREFFINKDLANHIIKRCNFPFGCDLHWTRFYDFFIIIPAYLLDFFLKDINQSIEYIGFFVTPIVKSITAIVLLITFQRIMNNYNAWFTVILSTVDPFLMPIEGFGRPDHHAFIVLFIAIYICILFSTIDANFSSYKKTVLAAITASLCVWISPETLIVLIVSDAMFFIYSFYNESIRNYLINKNVLTFAFLSFIVFICAPLSANNVIAFMVTTILAVVSIKMKKTNLVILLQLIAITSYAFVFDIEYDKISVVHVSLYLASVAFFMLNDHFSQAQISRKAMLSAASAVIIGIVFLYSYPDFFKGMSANVSDYVKRIWLNRVMEMQSPFQKDVRYAFAFYLVITFVMTIVKIAKLRFQNNAYSMKWWIIIAISTCYTIFACFAHRMWAYSALFGLPIIASCCMEETFFKWRYVKICASFFFSYLFLFFVPLLCGGEKAKDKESKNPSYREKELFLELDKISDTPVVILAHSNEGPKILYYTKHKAVGAPYHRQQQGIISSFEVIENTYDRNVVKRHLLTTQADYILIRKNQINAKNKNLGKLIEDGKIPAGMKVVPFSDKFRDMILLKIDRNNL